MFKPDITIIGNAAVDILAAPVSPEVFEIGTWPANNVKMSFGGDAQNESALLSRFGKKVELFSKLGDDQAGKSILARARENGVSVDKITLDPTMPSPISIVLITENGERNFVSDAKCSMRRLVEDDIYPILDTAADIVSFASLFVSTSMDIASATRVFKAIKSKPGRILTVDVTKAKFGETLDDLRELLPYVDYFFPNNDEAAMLTGTHDAHKNAALFVEAGVGCAVVKVGSKGCIIRTKDECIEIPAYKVENCVDTTGAGDSFAAGFIYGLSEGMSLADCGRFACATASCIVECVGATDGVMSIDKPMARFKELKEMADEK